MGDHSKRVVPRKGGVRVNKNTGQAHRVRDHSTTVKKNEYANPFSRKKLSKQKKVTSNLSDMVAGKDLEETNPSINLVSEENMVSGHTKESEAGKLVELQKGKYYFNPQVDPNKKPKKISGQSRDQLQGDLHAENNSGRRLQHDVLLLVKGVVKEKNGGQYKVVNSYDKNHVINCVSTTQEPDIGDLVKVSVPSSRKNEGTIIEIISKGRSKKSSEKKSDAIENGSRIKAVESHSEQTDSLKNDPFKNVVILAEMKDRKFQAESPPPPHPSWNDLIPKNWDGIFEEAGLDSWKKNNQHPNSFDVNLGDQVFKVTPKDVESLNEYEGNIFTYIYKGKKFNIEKINEFSLEERFQNNLSFWKMKKYFEGKK